MDLQHPTAKMSKSLDSPQGTISLLDEPKAITKKIKTAVTDSDTEVRFDLDAKPGVSNLLQILRRGHRRTDPRPRGRVRGSGYGTFKTAVAEAVVEFLRPLQERYAELAADPGEVARMLAVGADRAEGIAAGAMARVRAAIGLLPRGDGRRDRRRRRPSDGTPARRYRRRSEGSSSTAPRSSATRCTRSR